jgi:hypothetical protein
MHPVARLFFYTMEKEKPPSGRGRFIRAKKNQEGSFSRLTANAKI